MPISRVASGSISCLFALTLSATGPAKSQDAPVSTPEVPKLEDKNIAALEGDWVRVADGCADLPDEQVRALPQSGGGNRISFFETLSFRGTKYLSRTLPSPRCSSEYQPTGPLLETRRPQCEPGMSSGTVTVDGPEHLVLNATKHSGLNYWGYEDNDFEFKVIDGNVLFIHGGNPVRYCPDANHRIYFIRDKST